MPLQESEPGGLPVDSRSPSALIASNPRETGSGAVLPGILTMMEPFCAWHRGEEDAVCPHSVLYFFHLSSTFTLLCLQSPL